MEGRAPSAGGSDAGGAHSRKNDTDDWTVDEVHPAWLSYCLARASHITGLEGTSWMMVQSSKAKQPTRDVGVCKSDSAICGSRLPSLVGLFSVENLPLVGVSSHSTCHPLVGETDGDSKIRRWQLCKESVTAAIIASQTQCLASGIRYVSAGRRAVFP